MTELQHPQLDPVLAHSLLGTVAAVKGALDTIMTHNLEGSSREAMLLMAIRRLQHLSDQLRHVALGLPDAVEAHPLPE